MKKKFVNIALSLASLVGMLGFTTVFGATPASAAWADCGTNRFCAWDGANGTGTRWEFHSNWYYAGPCWLVTPSKGLQQWTSVWNRMPAGQRVNIYNNDGCFLPSAATIQSNQQVNLSNLGFNNINRAFRILP
jgi:hypothetical protein